MNLQIKWIGCAPGNWQTARAGQHPEAIVIHLMDGSLAGTDEWFNTEPWKRPEPKSASASHYGIGKDGTVHQYVYDQHRAYHAGNVVEPTAQLVIDKKGINPNLWTIGIEHEGRMTDEGPWPDAQLAASAQLLAELSVNWHIPLDRTHIFGHHEVYAPKPCPGPGVDLDKLILAAVAATKKDEQNA